MVLKRKLYLLSASLKYVASDFKIKSYGFPIYGDKIPSYSSLKQAAYT